ncbi:unnamed protein product [Moneuplotes crassus]|uniref:Uncharacterized protein n=1 Tax=Euplotes crassus TaxID=5936 RepID=A0AAD1X375_EUPCR|nr:unnamed protein product [Moneuplotes crassus]
MGGPLDDRGKAIQIEDQEKKKVIEEGNQTKIRLCSPPKTTLLESPIINLKTTHINFTHEENDTILGHNSPCSSKFGGEANDYNDILDSPMIPIQRNQLKLIKNCSRNYQEMAHTEYSQTDLSVTSRAAPKIGCEIQQRKDTLSAIKDTSRKVLVQTPFKVKKIKSDSKPKIKHLYHSLNKKSHRNLKVNRILIY